LKENNSVLKREADLWKEEISGLREELKTINNQLIEQTKKVESYEGFFLSIKNISYELMKHYL
jgi:hypothetical protein